jgi:acyl carrier protein
VTRDELRQAVLDVLRQIAPEADVSRLEPDKAIRDQLDVDSIDFMRLLIGVNERLHVDIPEADYPKVATIQGMVEYIARASAGPA